MPETNPAATKNGGRMRKGLGFIPVGIVVALALMVTGGLEAVALSTRTFVMLPRV
jgi:hypothetical protein